MQIATDLDGNVIAVGCEPVHGARHDAHAHAASGLAETLAHVHTAADPGYVGVNGIDITPVRKPPRADLHPHDAAFNKSLSPVRAPVERAVAHLKTWRILSEEGGRYRPPLEKFASALKAAVGLHFLSRL